MPTYTVPPDNRAAGQSGHIADHNEIADVIGLYAGAAGGGWANVKNTAFTGGAKGDGTTDDTVAIQAAENAAAVTGGVVVFPAGTYVVSAALVKQAGTIWQGAGRDATTILLRSGANTDVVQGAGFTALTLTGSTGGIGGWGIRDLTIDGNKAAQSGPSFGVRVYGFDFDLYNVTIRNCFSDGLYTEWSSFAGFPPGSDQSMEARYYGLKIYGCNGNGWHDRGPHDSRGFDVTIYNNGAGLYGYWSEGAASTTVAAPSNGVNVSTFTGSGVLNVATTLCFPTASISATQGSLTVTTSGGTAVITYTGVTAATFTGCTTISGTGTVSTGGSVKPTGTYSYSAAAMLLSFCHCYGSAAGYQYQLDTSTHLNCCIGEVAATGTVMARSFSKITGGLYYVAAGATQTGCGIQLGDAANAATRCYIRTSVENFACTSAVTACLNIVNDGNANDVEINAYAPAGTAVWAGTAFSGSRFVVRATGQSATVNAAASLSWGTEGATTIRVPDTAGNAWRVQNANGLADLLNLNSSSKRAELVQGYELRAYSDNYTTPTIRIGGGTGHLGTGVPNGVSLSAAAGAGAGTSPPAPTLLASSTDVQGQLNMGTGTAPAAGAQASVTFATVYGAAPVVVVSPVSAGTAALQPYVTSTTGGFTVSFGAAPAASQATGTYKVNYIVLALGA